MSVQLFISDRKNKKYVVVFQYNNKIKEVNFGDSRYEDFTQHKDPVRKERYIKRKVITWLDMVHNRDLEFKIGMIH